ncbi:uncharacterized protein [Physcomitrium patens]|uniref:Uncharacterized protein n=1 Tax=Physcomitrium patens TaxID=3218 RepID=A0A2K1IUM2_PHYPA|nr:uncharacterized protein LOC112273069 [Physcomitrium patens]PNR32958.1 hypothetical protein PHYPA_024901 [Physcomitrium patens]|eukprot:XP_024357188.1 uncharacterized protein LOC112273069 [Physcomitrella patens]
MWTATLCPPLLRFRHVPVVGASPIVRARSTARVNVSQSVNHGVRAQVSGSGEKEVQVELRTCRSCKQKYNPLENHPRACRFHTAHFGGETKRKFESVYTGGTMDTVGGGEISQYWHCCGSEDPFDPGCEAAPHMSYDD